MSANFVSAVIKVIHASSVFLFLIVCLFTGCQTTDKETLVLSDAGIASANTHSNPPVLIYVPFYFGGGYTGRIALPSDKHKTTGQIHVVVRGEVVSPGPIRLPTGSTILQAIGAVGGFTAYPYTQEFTVTKNSGRKVVVYFHSHRILHRDPNSSQWQFAW